LLLLLIFGAAVLVATQLFPFLPGLLGAITLYILLRGWYLKITVVYNWKKGLAAALFILGSIGIIVTFISLIFLMVAPKIIGVTHNPAIITIAITQLSQQIHHAFPQFTIDQAQIQELIRKGLSALPGFFGATLQVFSNLLLCFFLLYFMLISGRKMERNLQRFMALKDRNIDDLWTNTRNMVVSNAIGIPLLASFQAISAFIGYWIFNLQDALLWGIITGVCSVLPIIGTSVIWAPIVVFMYANGHPGQATGILLYSVIVTVNIDNILRFSLLKKLGDVHPVITILGIIVGVPLFGFMGLIFGPLLLSYFLLLIRVYQVEFAARTNEDGNRNMDSDDQQ